MGLITSLKVLASMHAGFGLAGLVLFYFAGDMVAYGGSAAFLAETPLAAHFEGDNSGWRIQSILDVKGMFDQITSVGDTIFGLAAFEYDVVTDIQSGTFLYWVVFPFRLFSWGMTIATTLQLARMVFSSGILQSRTGLILVTAGGSITAALAGLGAIS